MKTTEDTEEHRLRHEAHIMMVAGPPQSLTKQRLQTASLLLNPRKQDSVVSETGKGGN